MKKIIIILILVLSSFSYAETTHEKIKVDAVVVKKMHVPDTRRCIFYANGSMSCTGYPERFYTEIRYLNAASHTFDREVYDKYNEGDKFPAYLINVYENGNLVRIILIGREE